MLRCVSATVLVSPSPNLFRACVHPFQRALSSLGVENEDVDRVKKGKEVAWLKNFELLKSFVEKHGHMQVRKNHDGALKRWLDQQRFMYGRRELGEATSLSDERIEKLESLGIVWRVHEKAWEDYYQQLKEFAEENGHLSVPRPHELYNWIQAQRRNHNQESPTRLSQERIERLDQLGFVWDHHESVWNEHYQDLCRFRENHGHCSVPRLYSVDPTLARWVDLQRQQNRKLKNGKTSGLTPRRRELLDRIGFTWSVQEAMWQESFQELQQFVHTNGLGRAPPASSTLGRWLSNQRKMYKRMMNGEKVALTRERLKLLRSQGFCL